MTGYAGWPVLADRGVAAGTRVAFLDKNHPVVIELMLAGAWLGAVTVPVNYRLAPVEIAYVLAVAVCSWVRVAIDQLGVP
jgi:acyl-CoA synthetase (AMP-forming)/AMP-acid ligase II